MKKKLPPKKIFYRFIENNTKISFGEYLSAKWFNICNPFKLDDRIEWNKRRDELRRFYDRTKRELSIVPYGSSPNQPLNNEEVKALLLRK
jgi:hypothetical protein